jgi:hypothetical protein
MVAIASPTPFETILERWEGNINMQSLSTFPLSLSRMQYSLVLLHCMQLNARLQIELLQSRG